MPKLIEKIFEGGSFGKRDDDSPSTFVFKTKDFEWATTDDPRPLLRELGVKVKYKEERVADEYEYESAIFKIKVGRVTEWDDAPEYVDRGKPWMVRYKNRGQSFDFDPRSLLGLLNYEFDLVEGTYDEVQKLMYS
jgi:hypothetical protein